MDGRLLAATIGAFAVLVVICLLPTAADGPEDQGDGRTHVVMPRHVKTPAARPRTWLFLAVSAVLGLVFLGWQRPSAPGAYDDLVRALVTAITRNPASANGYVARLRPATEFLAVAYIIGISAVARASLARRLAMLSHVLLYLALSVLLQSLLITAGMATGWLIAPFGIEATLANLLVGGFVIIRMTFTTFVLPRGTTVRRDRPRWVWDDVLAWCALIAMVGLVVLAYAFLAEPGNLSSVWQVFVPLYALSILFVLLYVPLWLLWWTSRRLPEPDQDRPAVDVIIPAYNEEDNLARLLRSVDVATARYGGPVRVVVSDDGSTDGTAEIARAEITAFKHARGRVLSAPNGGQAAALNRGIAITQAEIIVRIDADCVMGPDALLYSVPWFRDPRIGTVGAMEEPRTDTVTWFHRLRVLECLFQFRFARLGQSLVDGIVVIPGTFTAFRRAPATLAGGFPVGMNGEDADLTMQIGRLGYRAVVDPRIRSYEDVPRSAGRVRRAADPVGPGRLPRLRPARGPARRLGRAAGVAVVDAPRFLLVLAASGHGGADLHGRAGADPSQLPPERRHLRLALRGRRRGSARHQPAARDQVPVLAQPALAADLVRLRLPQAAGHARSRNLTAHPPISRDGCSACGATCSIRPAG